MSSNKDFSNIFISSCSATLVAEILTLPICTIKTNYQNNSKLSLNQTIKEIYTSNGYKGFFSASTPAIISQILSTSTKLSFYYQLKSYRKTKDSDILNNSINGVISGFLGNLITHPIDVWKNYKQRNEHFSKHIIDTWKNKQLVTKGLYPGFVSSIGKNMALYSCLFPLNDFYKTKFDSIYISAPLTTLTVSLIVQPFDYYKVVKMAGNKPSHPFRGFGLMLARNIPHFVITMSLTNYISQKLN